MSASDNPRHLSVSVEHFTPPEIVEPSRRVLGRIDLDPASCALANETVRATAFRSTFDDAQACTLEQPWGRTGLGVTVFLNPPGGRTQDNASSQKAWWFKLEREWRARRVSAAIFVCFSLELLQTTQVKTPSGGYVPLEFPICYPARRIAYFRPDGAGGIERGASPPHSSAIVYLPCRWEQSEAWDFGCVGDFVARFSPRGRVVVPR